MIVTWEQVKPSFAEVRYPDMGDSSQWDWWFATAWGHLTAAGLSECSTPLELTQVQMRAFVLCWLGHDFCEVTFGDSAGGEPHWGDWLGDWNMESGLCLVLAATLPRFAEFARMVEAEVHRQSDADFEGLSDMAEEFSERVAGGVASFVAAEYREDVVDTLLKGFGDYTQLYASLWTATENWDVLRERLEDMDDELEAEDQTTVPSEDILEARVRERAWESAFEVSGPRMVALEWVQNGCPVEVLGFPDDIGGWIGLERNRNDRE